MIKHIYSLPKAHLQGEVKVKMGKNFQFSNLIFCSRFDLANYQIEALFVLKMKMINIQMKILPLSSTREYGINTLAQFIKTLKVYAHTTH